MQYKIVADSRVETLEKRVKESLENGWQLYEAPFSHKDSICQAMVKYDLPVVNTAAIEFVSEHISGLS